MTRLRKRLMIVLRITRKILEIDMKLIAFGFTSMMVVLVSLIAPSAQTLDAAHSGQIVNVAFLLPE